jgi:dihydroorotate dehydrogenase/Pyruvate/2-oxoacid:ferredoxin oxidoreductase delta subunit
MSKLKGKFTGYQTDGVIVAASSPATESAEKILECQKNGAAAIILKTASKTRMASLCAVPRRCFVRDGLFWAKSSFNREILTLDQSEALVRSCKTSGVTIPVAASVTELSLKTADWLDDCKRMEAAGADAVQLNFFYVENMFSKSGFENRFVKLLCTIRENTRIPVMPKLNIALPAEYAAHLLKQGGIKYVSLLDSIKTPSPVFIDWQEDVSGQRPNISFEGSLNGGGLSVFGSFMLPITAQYTNTLVKAGFEVCAGGGVTNGGSAANLLFLGASSVQVATDVLLNGYRRFADLNKEIDLIDSHAVSAHFQGRCGDLRLFHELGDKIRNYKDTKHHAELYADRCDSFPCLQQCANQTFCSFICMKENKPSFSGCEGCGLCAILCSMNSIRIARDT